MVVGGLLLLRGGSDCLDDGFDAVDKDHDCDESLDRVLHDSGDDEVHEDEDEDEGFEDVKQKSVHHGGILESFVCKWLISRIMTEFTIEHSRRSVYSYTRKVDSPESCCDMNGSIEKTVFLAQVVRHVYHIMSVADIWRVDKAVSEFWP